MLLQRWIQKYNIASTNCDRLLTLIAQTRRVLVSAPWQNIP